MADGLWYSPYLKIYSLEGDNRLAEISYYPLVKEDKSRHVYEEDKFFIVKTKDAIFKGRDSKESVFIQRDGVEKKVGETASRKGTRLPGIFPKWVPETTKIEDKQLSEYVYPVISDVFIGELVHLVVESAWVEEKNKKVYLDRSELLKLINQIANNEIKLPYKGLLSIKYRRIFK